MIDGNDEIIAGATVNMDNMNENTAADNLAWVQADIPLPPERLLDFLAASDRLWRLNPFLTIESLKENADHGFRLIANNDANGCHLDLAVSRESLPPGGFRFSYDKGLKQTTEFAVEPRGAGSLLTVTERYDPAAAPDARAKEIDSSLLPWVTALRKHIVARSRWGGLPGWQVLTEDIMLSLAPRRRRIVRVVAWLTVIELALLLGLAVVLRFVG